MQAQATHAVSHHHRHKKSVKKAMIFGSMMVGIPVAVASAWIWRGCDEYVWVVGVASAAIGAPAFLVAWIAFQVSKRQTRLVAKAIAVGCFVLLQLIGLIMGKSLYKSDVTQAKKFCESLTPQIDDVKKKYGRYPPNLDRILPANTKYPRLISSQDTKFYWATPRVYGFSFIDPHRLGSKDKLCYSSDRREWYSCGD